jgi:hypothetical protein
MNCRRRGTAQAKKPDDPNKKGNGVQTYADKAGMERDNRPVQRPYWEDPPAVVETRN